LKLGLLTVPKKNKKNVFNGRILEIEWETDGPAKLSVDQAFELTDASAERSAAASCIRLSQESVARFMCSSLALIDRLIEDGYRDADTLKRRKAAIEAWLAKPSLLTADANAAYAATFDIDLNELTEPLLACPNDPDDIKPLSAVAGTPVHDVFLGSCMTHIGHFRAAGQLWQGRRQNAAVRTTICPPTRFDQARLKEEAYFSLFNQIGARIETPGCSLCMGNQLRVPDGVTVFSTSTRNFDDRMGKDAKVFLGSAELGALTAVLGRLPSIDEYFAEMHKRVLPKADVIYAPLQLDVATR
jgi:aconitate hydratase 2/2-methylisocitrate dehydratase